MAELTDLIPTAILGRLLGLRDVLSHSGSVQRRPARGQRQGYRLRVRVPDPVRGRRQISIRLADAGVAGAVNALLQEWRVEHDERIAKDAAERMAAEKAGQEAREELRRRRREAQDLGGGGRRRRREPRGFLTRRWPGDPCTNGPSGPARSTRGRAGGVVGRKRPGWPEF